jgi:hypothetical protein
MRGKVPHPLRAAGKIIMLVLSCVLAPCGFVGRSQCFAETCCLPFSGLKCQGFKVEDFNQREGIQEYKPQIQLGDQELATARNA